MPESYAPLDARRQAVTIVFAGIALVSIAAVIVDVLDLAILDRLIAGEDVTDAELNADDARMRLVGLLQFAAYIAGAVVFIRWLHRAYRNVDSVAPQERRYGHGWAIGAWFVPILSLWRPKQVVNDVWRAGGGDGPGALLWFWWAVFLVSGWAGNIALRSFLNDDTPAARPPGRPRRRDRYAAAGPHRGRVGGARAPGGRARVGPSGGRARVAVPCATPPTI